LPNTSSLILDDGQIHDLILVGSRGHDAAWAAAGVRNARSRARSRGVVDPGEVGLDLFAEDITNDNLGVGWVSKNLLSVDVIRVDGDLDDTHVNEITNTDTVDDLLVASPDLVRSAHAARLTSGVLSELAPERAVPANAELLGDLASSVQLTVASRILVDDVGITEGLSNESTAVVAILIVRVLRASIGVVDNDSTEEVHWAHVGRSTSGTVELNLHSIAHPVLTALNANVVDNSIRAVLAESGIILSVLARSVVNTTYETSTSSVDGNSQSKDSRNEQQRAHVANV